MYTFDLLFSKVRNIMHLQEQFLKYLLSIIYENLYSFYKSNFRENINRLRATGTLRKNHYRGSRVLEDRLADCLTLLRHGFSGNL